MFAALSKGACMLLQKARVICGCRVVRLEPALEVERTPAYIIGGSGARLR